jgi:hypothetical protein
LGLHEHVVNVPSLNEKVGDFEWLFGAIAEIDAALSSRPGLRIIFDFSSCSFLQQNAVILLGGIARTAEQRGGQVVFRWDTLQSDVCKNLQKNGFLAAFGHPRQGGRGSTISYREHRIVEKTSVLNYLQTEWLRRGWVNMTESVQNAVAGNIWEIYANAFEHARSPIGVLSCGQYYPRMRSVKFTVADFGIGIPGNVRNHFGNRINAARALEWAFQRGTSTQRSTNIPRGLGLSTVRDLIRANNGRLELFSNEGHMVIHGSQEEYDSQKHSFNGTILTIELHCDSLLYCFANEVKGGRRKNGKR